MAATGQDDLSSVIIAMLSLFLYTRTPSCDVCIRFLHKYIYCEKSTTVVPIDRVVVVIAIRLVTRLIDNEKYQIVQTYLGGEKFLRFFIEW